MVYVPFSQRSSKIHTASSLNICDDENNINHSSTHYKSRAMITDRHGQKLWEYILKNGQKLITLLLLKCIITDYIFYIAAFIPAALWGCVMRSSALAKSQCQLNGGNSRTLTVMSTAEFYNFPYSTESSSWAKYQPTENSSDCSNCVFMNSVVHSN